MPFRSREKSNPEHRQVTSWLQMDAAPFVDPIPNLSNLLLYWKCEDASGSTTAADDSGNSFTGSLADTPTFGNTSLLSTGGTSLLTTSSGGVTCGLYVAQNATLRPSGDCAGGCWMKKTDTTVNKSLIGMLPNALNTGWYLYVLNPGATQYLTQLTFTSAGLQQCISTNSIILDGSRHFVMWDYTSSSGVVNLYVDDPTNYDTTQTVGTGGLIWGGTEEFNLGTSRALENTFGAGSYTSQSTNFQRAFYCGSVPTQQQRQDIWNAFK